MQMLCERRWVLDAGVRIDLRLNSEDGPAAGCSTPGRGAVEVTVSLDQAAYGVSTIASAREGMQD